MNQNLTLLPQSTILSPEVPWKYFNKFLWLPDPSRSMGIHLMAGKGSGKSRLMGRIISWMDFLRGVPQVIFDPHGPTIDNFLDKLIRLPIELQSKLWSRVVYVDMSGRSGYTFPFPLYYRIKDESLYEISQRFLDVVRRIDPYLQTASVEGWNALWRTGTYTGMILAALGYQISEAESLLKDPDEWEGLFSSALNQYPELIPAVNYLLEMSHLKENYQSRRTEAFFNKIALFSLDSNMKAMFGAGKPGIIWEDVINKRQTVLFDFRHEHDLERRRFKMVWVFNYFLDFIKQRGAGRHQPIGLVIDELTSLFSIQSLNGELFGSELDELINVIARNYSIWLTIAHQEMFQVTERILKSLMTMGTQILGVTTDPEAAKYLAMLYYQYNPYLVKKVEAVYGSIEGVPMQIDQRTIEFTIEEQLILQSYRFLKQGRFHFLAKPAAGEGDIRGRLCPISIDNFDRNVFPIPEIIAQKREQLMRQNGFPIQEILKDMEHRLQLPEGIKRLSKQKTKPVSEPKEDVSIWG
jgi:hypothetical protein